MQAIITKFLGPTNFRGSRVKASCEAGSLVMSWDDALDPDANHSKAAHALASKLDWLEGYRLAGGTMPRNCSHHNCYVLVPLVP